MPLRIGSVRWVLAINLIVLSEWLERPMSALRCYLDYNATTPLRPDACDAIVAALGQTGNPSSVHHEGRQARWLVEAARAAVAELVGAAPERIVFTSGATEAANLALSPDLTGPSAPRGTTRILIGATEHAAVLHGHRFAADRVTVLPVRRDGRLELEALSAALAADGGSPALLALQAANNETGVLQPLGEAVARVHAAGGLIVSDAVQIAGRVPFDLEASSIDVALLSGHKIGGPHGTGAVAMAKGVALGASPRRGGGQERGHRAGTENVAGLAGFGVAAMAAQVLECDRLEALRTQLEDGLAGLAGDLTVFGAASTRLPNTTCFAVPGAAAEVLLIALDLAGVAVSSGSACSSGRVSRSHVLAAMGVKADLASGALRVSTGWASSRNDIERFLETFAKALARIRTRPLPAAA